MTKNNWTKCKLGDVCYPVSNTYNLAKRKEIIFINTGDILEGKFLKNTYEATEQLPGQAKKAIEKDDILFSEIRPENGRYALVDFDAKEYVVSTKLMVIRAKPIIWNIYLYKLLTNKYAVKEFQHIAESRSGTFPQITFDAISHYPVSLPPLEEQKRIAGVLGAFDDKIELLQKQNKTLEDMAKAIFKSWFVDFDIVKAKERGEDKQKILSTYKITEELYNLFPSSFTDAPASSSLGPIPTGWEVKQIKDIAILTMGQSPSGNTYNEAGEGLPFYQGRTDFGFRFPSKRVYCSKPTRIAQAHDILISVRAPVGDLNIALEECCIGRGVGSIRSNTSDYSFIYYSLLNIQNALKSFDNEGTVFGSINKDTLSSLKVIYPQQILVNEYDNLTSKLDNKIEANTKQIQTLTELRDGLLPRLLSGKLKV